MARNPGFKALCELYFHQDFDLMAASFEEAVDKFKKDSDQNLSQQAASHLSDFLEGSPTYEEMMDYWFDHGAEIFFADETQIRTLLTTLQRQLEK